MNKLAHKITWIKEEINRDLGMGPVANQIECLMSVKIFPPNAYHLQMTLMCIGMRIL